MAYRPGHQGETMEVVDLALQHPSERREHPLRLSR